MFSLDLGAYLLWAKYLARTFEPEPWLVPPLNWTLYQSFKTGFCIFQCTLLRLEEKNWQGVFCERKPAWIFLHLHEKLPQLKKFSSDSCYLARSLLMVIAVIKSWAYFCHHDMFHTLDEKNWLCHYFCIFSLSLSHSLQPFFPLFSEKRSFSVHFSF